MVFRVRCWHDVTYYTDLTCNCCQRRCAWCLRLILTVFMFAGPDRAVHTEL
jgi:hypothetical protein